MSNSKEKIRVPDVADFIVHSLLAVPVAMFVGFLPEALAGRLYVNTPLEPFTPMIALSAVCLAVFSSRWVASKVARWVWILPLLWFFYNGWDLMRSWSPAWDSSSSRWTYALKELLSSHCGSSECLYELFATTPLAASAAYAITYFFVMKSPPKRRLRWDDIGKPDMVS